MAKFVIIDNRMRKIEKQKLKELGYNILEIPLNIDLYSEISSHVDIFCCKIKDELVIEKNVYENVLKKILDNVKNINGLKKNIIVGENTLKNKYPYDIPYNACIIGDYAIHNFKYTDSNILNLIDKYNLKKLHIKQGYSKCSIAVIDEKSAIVQDESIAKILNGNGVETLLLKNVDELKYNLKLLDKNNCYSKMNGFIGGCISRIDDKIFVSGELKKIDKYCKLRDFIEKRNLEIIDFEGLDIIDYGGIIEVDI